MVQNGSSTGKQLRTEKKTKSVKHNGVLKGFIIVFNIMDIKNVETIL